MEYYVEPEKKIPVTDRVDVLVAGGGPAGIGAAVAAARQGCKTMLIEQAGDVGGVATTGMMSHWTGETRGGLYEEILDRSRDDERNGDRQTINPEKLKNVLLEMLEEAGVLVRTYTFASDVVMEGDRIRGVLLESKSGREAVMAGTVIDCTGDGDLAARAGAPFYKGREEDGQMQPMTLMFKVAGVDEKRAIFPGSFETNIPVPDGMVQDLGKSKPAFSRRACVTVPFHDSRGGNRKYDQLHRSRWNQCGGFGQGAPGLPDADGGNCSIFKAFRAWI